MVLGALKNDHPDGYYCAGDIVGYGADPAACIQKTQELNPHIIAGNHDWGAVALADVENFSKNAKEAILWTTDALSGPQKGYLKVLQLLWKNDFMMVHGSPDQPEEFEYILGLSAAYKAFLAMDNEDICFIGHSHVAGVFVKDSFGQINYNSWPQVKLETGNKYIINVGSVGQPRDNDPRAAYCIYDTEKQMVEIKRVSYDIKQAQAKIIKAGLPRILAERLALGK